MLKVLQAVAYVALRHQQQQFVESAESGFHLLTGGTSLLLNFLNLCGEDIYDLILSLLSELSISVSYFPLELVSIL